MLANNHRRVRMGWPAPGVSRTAACPTVPPGTTFSDRTPSGTRRQTNTVVVPGADAAAMIVPSLTGSLRAGMNGGGAGGPPGSPIRCAKPLIASADVP
ncbi:hypothetical protein SAMN02787118_13489 [Streptomyces mirabilis]|uniref:Uncharacterized protein n=1 Tax=Streptomyces mirabilis TaxID=68239 RepID=A0A1I2W2A6_9ACTN|nr:hypothetical protein SAMN02787118_13489 [Streptomyces mirabilis]